jgi:hypothetical protein
MPKLVALRGSNSISPLELAMLLFASVIDGALRGALVGGVIGGVVGLILYALKAVAKKK